VSRASSGVILLMRILPISLFKVISIRPLIEVLTVLNEKAEEMVTKGKGGEQSNVLTFSSLKVRVIVKYLILHRIKIAQYYVRTRTKPTADFSNSRKLYEM
jgi:hypothetical protein